MKITSFLREAVCTACIALLYLVPANLDAHITVMAHTVDDLHAIYSLNNQKTPLMYHLESGMIYKQSIKGIEQVKTHAHIVCSEFKPHGAVLGYIKKTDGCNAPKKYFVYIETTKPS